MNLNVTCKTIKLLEENIWENICDLDFGYQNEKNLRNDHSQEGHKELLYAI